MEFQNYQSKIEFLKSTVKSIPDYPKKGVLFRDVSSLCQNGDAFALAIDLLHEHYKDANITKVVCAEARGFIFGAPLAASLHAGLVLVRKPGKLPRETIEESYSLEYGVSTLQIHKDSINENDNILVLDDLIATGGTVEAMMKLVTRLKGKISNAAFIIDLPDLGGVDKIKKDWNINCFSLLEFPGQ